MANYIRCRYCSTLNKASAFECEECGRDLTNPRNRLVVENDSLLAHDFEREEIEEIECNVCKAINPIGIEKCLACGSELKTEIQENEQENVQEIAVPKVQNQISYTPKAIRKPMSMTTSMKNHVAKPEMKAEKINEKAIHYLVDVKTEARYEIEKGDFVLGRYYEWGEVLDNYGYVSGKHMLIRNNGTEVSIICDLKARNGTYRINGNEFEELKRGRLVKLKNGDLLALGGHNTDDENVAIVRYEKC